MIAVGGLSTLLLGGRASRSSPGLGAEFVPQLDEGDLIVEAQAPARRRPDSESVALGLPRSSAPCARVPEVLTTP